MDLFWALWVVLSLETTAVQVGDEYESTICALWIYVVFLSDFFKSSDWDET
jgi:hypothetical protein